MGGFGSSASSTSGMVSRVKEGCQRRIFSSGITRGGLRLARKVCRRKEDWGHIRPLNAEHGFVCWVTQVSSLLPCGVSGRSAPSSDWRSSFFWWEKRHLKKPHPLTLHHSHSPHFHPHPCCSQLSAEIAHTSSDHSSLGCSSLDGRWRQKGKQSSSVQDCVFQMIWKARSIWNWIWLTVYVWDLELAKIIWCFPNSETWTTEH